MWHTALCNNSLSQPQTDHSCRKPAKPTGHLLQSQPQTGQLTIQSGEVIGLFGVILALHTDITTSTSAGRPGTWRSLRAFLCAALTSLSDFLEDILALPDNPDSASSG